MTAGWNGSGRVVLDENRYPLRLDRLLGSGGQGEVWASGSRVAVKLLRARTPRAKAALRERLAIVRRLDLDGLPVSRPHAMLADPHVGYTMDLLADMGPLRALAVPDRRDLLAWYAASGGLRRRLDLLAGAADVLAALHARGIVYGDPSPANILISDDPAQDQVWLIDADTLEVVSEVPEPGYATPGYAAPELLAGTGGVSSLSDAYAFAIIVFETLAVVHPFLGDAVEEGEPEEQDRAFAGELPWVDDLDDPRNRSAYGLDRSLVLTPGLRKLAAQAFGEGRRRPAARPTIAEWRTKLHAAADLLVRCGQCKQTSFVGTSLCPWCAAQVRTPILARVHMTMPGEPEPSPLNEAVVVQADEWLGVRGRTAALCSDGRPGTPVAWLWWEPRRLLLVRNRGTEPLWLRPRTGGAPLSVAPGEERVVPAYPDVPEWELHFGHESRPHRMLRFKSLKGVSR